MTLAEILERLLQDFSYWFPKARDYGYSATDLYMTAENAILMLIPIPLVLDGDYKFWLFCFCRAEKVNPRIKDLILAEIAETFDTGKHSHLISRETYFIIAGIVRGRIPPKLGRKSVYVIKADYVYKVYEITAKAILRFVESFRKNVKYGNDLLILCDELERFAERLKKRGEELKFGMAMANSVSNSNLNSNSIAQPTPTPRPSILISKDENREELAERRETK